MRNLVVLSAVTVLMTLAAACGGGEEAPVVIPADTPTVAPAAKVADSTGDFTTIEVVNQESPYFFEPADITLEAGQSYRFVNISPKEFHTFTVDDLGIDVSIDGGTTVATDFTAPAKPGTYALVCLVHEAQGMIGTITIK